MLSSQALSGTGHERNCRCLLLHAFDLQSCTYSVRGGGTLYWTPEEPLRVCGTLVWWRFCFIVVYRIVLRALAWRICTALSFLRKRVARALSFDMWATRDVISFCGTKEHRIQSILFFSRKKGSVDSLQYPIFSPSLSTQTTPGT